jgi:RHS repeat-associated protein
MSPYFPYFPPISCPLFPDFLAETSATDTNPTQYIFFNGKRIARMDPGATTPKYYVSDNVGSTELVTDYLGNPLSESLFYPYGVEQVILSGDTNTYKFSGKERDPESGLDDFGARYYASNLGRFMSPDRDAKPTAVPYASFGDPQTLNLYSYVENAPLNRVDADGHATTTRTFENNWKELGEEGWSLQILGAWHQYCLGSGMEGIVGSGGGSADAFQQLDATQNQMDIAQKDAVQAAQQTNGSSDQYSHDIVLVGSKNKQDLAHAPVPEPDDGGFWTVDWMPYHLKNGQLDGPLAAGCPECSTDPKIQVSLKESLGGGPYQDMGTKPGHGHDSFLTGGNGAAASTPNVNQHWYVNGSRVQIVMGANPSTGKPILTWETHVSLSHSGPPVYSPVGSGDQ